MIFGASLPDFKRFLSNVQLSNHSREYLTRLVAGFINHRGRMSAQQASGAIAGMACHRAGVGRFLLLRGSALCYALHQLAKELLQLAALERGLYVLLLDVTSVSQQGQRTENTFSAGNRQRRPAKGRRYNKKKYTRRSCHALVFGLLLTPSGMRIPYYRSYYTRDYCRRKRLRYRTQTDVAADLIRGIELCPSVRVVVVGDTAFEARQIREACQARHFSWIMPANPERVLAGEKPRPKVSSLVEKLDPAQFNEIRLTPGKGAFAAQRRTSTCRIGPKTKTRTFYVHQERHCVQSIGETRLIFSTKDKPQPGTSVKLDSMKVLLTKDSELSVAEVVELFSVRWQIELFFKELKSHLGLHHYRFRRFACVEGWIHACLITFAYLEWLRYQRLRRRCLSEADCKWWQAQRTFGLCSAVRQRIVETELKTLQRRIQTPHGIKVLRKVLRAALPPENRKAA